MNRLLFVSVLLLCALVPALTPLRAAGRSDEVRALWVRGTSLNSAEAIVPTSLQLGPIPAVAEAPAVVGEDGGVGVNRRLQHVVRPDAGR